MDRKLGSLTEEDFASLSDEERHAVEKLIEIEQTIYHAAERGSINTYEPQEYQTPFHSSDLQNRWMICANRVGKTTMLAQEVRWFALGDHPYRDVGTRGEIWCVSKTFEKSKTVMIPMVRKALGAANIRRETSGAMPTIEVRDGPTILFKTYEQSPMTFESSAVRLAALDEEPPWKIFEPIWFRRGSDYPLDIVGAATMTEGLTWLYDKVVQRQLPSTDYWTASLDDNKYIPDSEKEMLKKGVSGVMYRIRIKGEVLPIGGTLRFNQDVLEHWWGQKAEPKFVGYRSTGRWVQDPEGPLTLYELPMPLEEYVLGVDVAEGLNTNYTDVEPEWDQTSIQILRRSTRTFVGDYTVGDEEPGYIGEEVLPAVSDWFGGAKANVELNNHGHAVIALAKKRMANRLLGPPPNRADKGWHLNRQYGFVTNSKTRGYLVDVLAGDVENSGPKTPRDDNGNPLPGYGITVLNPATLRQFMTFVRKDRRRVEHQAGAKDDRVIACGLAVVGDRDLPPHRVQRPRTDRDMLRDLARTNSVADLRMRM